MEEEPSHMTERILTLTLEIIFLLTGENFPPMKSGDQVIITLPPPKKLERNHEKKILEVTQKMMELLTGEVPIRCQDVTVYFSMEEWEYLEGHKELYKDVMMASQPALTSPDGSSNGKPPERCPRPLYSHRDPTQEGHTIPHHHQGEDVIDIKVEVKSEDEAYVRDDQQSMEEAGGERWMQDSSGFLERSSVQGRDMRRSSEDWLTLSAHCDHVEDEDTTHNSPGEEPHTQHVHPAPHTDHGPSHSSYPEEEPSTVRDGAVLQPDKRLSCSECGKCFRYPSALLVHKQFHAGEKPYSCSACGKCFVKRSHLSVHKRSHTGEKPYSCPECGKSFSQKSHVSVHQRSHVGEKPYSCPECGKCFITKSNLGRHLKSHKSVKPYICPECGKCFSLKSYLSIHLRSHTGEKPYSCPECGKSFVKKSDLDRHLKCHSGEKPYSCAECGKCFAQISHLYTHQRSHTGEKPHSCPECGRCFAQISHLYLHQRCHTGEKPHSCSDCGKRFVRPQNLAVHQRSHTGEKPYSCPECGKCFVRQQHLTRHRRSHAAEKS